MLSEFLQNFKPIIWSHPGCWAGFYLFGFIDSLASLNRCHTAEASLQFVQLVDALAFLVNKLLSVIVFWRYSQTDILNASALHRIQSHCACCMWCLTVYIAQQDQPQVVISSDSMWLPLISQLQPRPGADSAPFAYSDTLQVLQSIFG